MVHVHASAEGVAAAAVEAAGGGGPGGLPSVAAVGGAQQQEVEQENWLKRSDTKLQARESAMVFSLQSGAT